MENDGRRVIHRVRNTWLQSPNMMIIGEQVLSRGECDTIIQMHKSLPFTEVDYDVDGIPNKICPKDPSIMEHPWKYAARDGKEFAMLPNDSEYFEQAIELCFDYLPKNDDYGGINYVQIIRYPEECSFQFHKDSADDNDTATAIFFLNEEYEGGRLNVEGHQIMPRRGTMVTFNNSTERWHGVEPVYRGERYVFAIWFGAVEVTEEEVDDNDNTEV